jgi:cation/acetate symporter
MELFGSKEAILAAYRQFVAIPTIPADLKAPIQAMIANAASIQDGPLSGWLLWSDSVVLRNRVVGRLWGINNISGGIFGVPLSFLTIYLVSRFTTAPSQAMQDFIDSIRMPKGGVMLADAKQGVKE